MEGRGFAVIKWYAWTLSGGMAGLLLLMPVLTFFVPKQHYYSFIPSYFPSGEGRPAGCPLIERTWSRTAPLAVLNRALAPAGTVELWALHPLPPPASLAGRDGSQLGQKELINPFSCLSLDRSRSILGMFCFVLVWFFFLRSVRWGCILCYKVIAGLLCPSRAGREFLPLLSACSKCLQLAVRAWESLYKACGFMPLQPHVAFRNMHLTPFFRLFFFFFF